MSKGNITDAVDEVKVLTPSLSITTHNHKDLQHPVINIVSKNNEYVLVELDKDNQEVLGSEFTVGEVTFQRVFANNPQFKVKKNPR